MVVLDNDTGGVRAMVGGPDFEKAPFNLATNGHRQPGSSFKPFTLITALEQGHSTGEVFTSAPAGDPVPGQDSRTRTARRRSSTTSSRSTTTRTSTSARPRSPTATTYSDNSVYSQLGTQVGPANVAATAEKMGIETDLSTETEYSIADGPFEPYNPALILGGLETGVTRSRWRTPTTRSRPTASGSRARWPPAPAARSAIFEVATAATRTPDFDDGELVPDQTGASGENETIAKQVVDPAVAGDGQGRALDRGHLGHRRERRRPASRPGARPGPPTTTATPGSAARPRRSPPASGSATPTR